MSNVVSKSFSSDVDPELIVNLFDAVGVRAIVEVCDCGHCSDEEVKEHVIFLMMENDEMEDVTVPVFTMRPVWATMGTISGERKALFWRVRPHDPYEEHGFTFADWDFLDHSRQAREQVEAIVHTWIEVTFRRIK